MGRKATLGYDSSSLGNTVTVFFPLKKYCYGDFIFFFSPLGLFYKKVPVSARPSGTYYSSLVVINHGRVSISTQRLPRVSNSHSLTLSSAISFLSICPLLSSSLTWTRWNWSFSCWHALLFISCVTRQLEKGVLTADGWYTAWKRS